MWIAATTGMCTTPLLVCRVYSPSILSLETTRAVNVPS